MRFKDIQEAVGRITKQNQTVDVGPNEISKQAKKFGNTVDKDGRPPTLSKKVKGSKTNVLYNLGLAERFTPMELALMEGGHSLEDYYLSEAQEIASSSEIYVDMDGVLADFFGSWKNLIGKNWRNIDDIEPALQKIRDTDNFWLDLPLTNNAQNLLNLIKDVKGEYKILSSPLPNDPNSEPHKREWIKKNLNFFPPKDVIITHDKPKFATQQDGTPNILIDDYGKNIQSWESAGGVGFKHKDHKFERTAKNIKQHMQEPVKERELTKAEIKKRDKTADKIMDKPKAKKGIAKWAKDKGMDPEGAVYAIATNMAKEALRSGRYTPDQILEILENFADGKKNEARTPRMNPADVIAATKASSKPVSQEELQRIVNDYKSKPPNALPNLLNKVNVDTVINIAMMIGAPHLNFLQKFLVKKGIKFSRNVMHKALAQVENIEENFADGKKKGKSRPGRVKRAGASCDGSVTELRRKAKNASGERAKMYHWCANMKAGRQK